MTMRRLASAVLAGTALVGAPLVTAGIASANTSAGHHHEEGKGSLVYAPVYAPVDSSTPTNVCGNTINTVGQLNPAIGNTCTNAGGNGNVQHFSPGSATDNSAPSGVGALPGVPLS
jgi:hypothetical protein